MRTVLELQKVLAPDIVDTLKKRYSILRQIRYSGLVGRRTLASALNMTERMLRAETEFLKAQGLLDIDAAGMRVNETGAELLDEMEPMMKEWFGLTVLEDKIAAAFGLRQVVVVPGDSDKDPLAKRELGKAGAAALTKAAGAAAAQAPEQDTGHPLVIAVTGGSTIVEVAAHLNASPHLRGALYVPARGGLGESVELQAGTIASAMAKKTGGGYRLMHVPDDVSEEAIQSLMSEPHIREVADIVREARIVVHGIGEAIVMAKRRRVDQETIRMLQEGGAVAEAFGYYFNQDGSVVHRMPTVGLRLEDIERTETVIAVAGGASKAQAIAAVLRNGHEDVLVIDEAAAQHMLQFS
ncbi:sugar-binding transcriptional regulator [Paenibacillus thermotolerans]|uniref:sugar-binding transcriptional regulator n=1 Tax=Paenibacillus thermotolerans TaxID=3027807 RepID=UPI0023674AB7|nr:MULTISPECIES: sugar-binding domain-containing protein [unclassified Paenibacillus]